MKTFTLKKYAYAEPEVESVWAAYDSCHWTIYKRVNAAHPEIWTPEEKAKIEAFYTKAWELQRILDKAYWADVEAVKKVKADVEAKVQVAKYHALWCAWKKRVVNPDFDINRADSRIFFWSRKRIGKIGDRMLAATPERKAFETAKEEFDTFFNAGHRQVNELIGKILKPSYRFEQRWIGHKWNGD